MTFKQESLRSKTPLPFHTHTYSKQQLSAGNIRARICSHFQEPMNRFPAWRAGTKTLFVALARQATKVGKINSSESIPGLHKRLQIRALAAISSLCHCVIFLASFICAKHNRYTEYTQLNTMSCAGIFKLSRGARNRVGIGLSYRPARLTHQGELVPRNRFLGSLKV